MHLRVLNLVLLACGLSVAVGAQASSLVGDSVHAAYMYPDTSRVFSDLGAAVVGASSPTYANVNSAGVLDINITANKIVFNWTGSGASLPATFDGVKFTDLSHAFTGAVLDSATNTPGIIGSEVTLVGGTIFVDLNDGVYSAGQNVTVDVTTGVAVPEPANWALMLIGVGGVGAMARRGSTARPRAA